MSPIAKTILLLMASNVFMTFSNAVSARAG